ncbi:hypothetical protein Rleg2_5100 (plasmid) [Rhizobium leguminosarum bv. trifolii WSM2304]|uniref:Uncharacterized protein n=1 Tax=Rhizobium leguminosarum bv. trifolii (strain WSM2304) TaxID=395492 RepID=A0ABF7QW19_RHILW|nr:hypothetical protein Rleg2_5100 [Rhizobium leguminosarum bv. trifolii WSM2304]
MTTTLARYSWPADRAGDWVRCSARPMLSRVCSVVGRSGSRAGVRRFADDCGHRVERRASGRASARRALVPGIQSSLAGERHLRCVGPASPLRQPLRLYHRRRPIFAGALPSSSGNRFRPAPGRVRLARASPSCGSVLGFLLHHRIGTPRPGTSGSRANPKQRRPCPIMKIEFQSQRKPS